MITINLKPGTKRAKASGGTLAGGMGSFKALSGNIKDPWPMAAIAAWVLAIGFLAWVGVGGRKLIEWLPIVVRWFWRSTGGQLLYRRRIVRPRPVGTLPSRAPPRRGRTFTPGSPSSICEMNGGFRRSIR